MGSPALPLDRPPAWAATASARSWAPWFVLAAALGCAAVASGAVVRAPMLGLALAAMPFALAWLSKADRAFWTVVAVWLLGAESYTLLPSVTVFKALLIGVLMATGIELARRVRPPLPIDRRLALAGFLWVALGTLSLAYSTTPSYRTLLLITTNVGVASLLLIPAWFIDSYRALRRLIVFFAAQAVPVALLGALQAWFGEAFYFNGISQEQRAQSVYFNPNGLGMAMGIAVPLQLALAMNARTGRAKVGWSVCLVLSGAALIYSLSRSALVAGVLAVVMMLAVPLTRARAGAILALLLGAAALWRVHFSDYASDRFDIEELEDDPRRVALVEALRVFSQHPVLGVGTGRFREVTWQGIHVHNALVAVFVEGGLFAGLLFAGLVGSATWVGYRTWRRTREGPDRVLVKALAVTWATTFLNLNFHGATERANLLWFLMGAVFAVARIPVAVPAGADRTRGEGG